MLFLLPTRGGIRGSGATGTRRTSLHAVKNSSSVTVEVRLEKLISCHWSRLMRVQIFAVLETAFAFAFLGEIVVFLLVVLKLGTPGLF